MGRTGVLDPSPAPGSLLTRDARGIGGAIVATIAVASGRVDRLGGRGGMGCTCDLDATLAVESRRTYLAVRCGAIVTIITDTVAEGVGIRRGV